MVLPVLLLRPLNRWPMAVHAGLALMLLLATWALGTGLHSNAQGQLSGSQKSLDALETQARLSMTANTAKPVVTAPNFTLNLPSRDAANAVVRDMGRNAQGLGVTLGAMTVVHQAPSARELGKVQLTLTANGEYAKAKAWLAELLARYPSLAVQTLSVHAGAQGIRQEWQLVLALYVKD